MKKLVLAALVAALFVGCSKDDGDKKKGGGKANQNLGKITPENLVEFQKGHNADACPDISGRYLDDMGNGRTEEVTYLVEKFNQNARLTMNRPEMNPSIIEIDAQLHSIDAKESYIARCFDKKIQMAGVDTDKNVIAELEIFRTENGDVQLDVRKSDGAESKVQKRLN